MNPQLVNINDLKVNPGNPRHIRKDKFKKLKNNIQTLPVMMKMRPIVVDETMTVLGGNMRLRACKSLGWEKVYITKWEELSEDEKKQFIVLDNVGFGDWDWDVFANEVEWDVEKLEDWGLNVPAVKNTALLSELEYQSVYYEPTEKPHITLSDCVDMTLFHKKLDMIYDSDLPIGRQTLLKMFAYRFIKIDFENVANYYYFNASEEEQKVIERLRLVLIDDGVNGFIEDDLVDILSITDEEWT